MTQTTYPGYFPPPTPPPTPPTPQFPAQAPYPAVPGQLPYAPQYPPTQGYPQPQMTPPAQPLAQGSIDDFYSQPSGGGGKSLAFNVLGTRHIGIVTRALTNGDIQQQTNRQGVPQFFKDGRAKFLMKVPLQMQPSPEFPDGLATWFVKGAARDELARAMAEAGAPAGPPEPGSIIDVTYVADRPIPNMTPQKQFRVVYARPQGAAPVAPPPPAVNPAVPAAATQAPAIPLTPTPPAAAPAPAPVQAAPQPPADLSPEQQELLARLTAQQSS